MPPKTRTYDPAKVRTALAAQTEALRALVRGLSEEQLGRPTRLEGWTVRELVAHLALQVGWVPRRIDEPLTGKPELSLLQWATRVRERAPLMDAEARERAAEDVVAAFDREAALLIGVLAGPEVADPVRRLETRIGSLRLSDVLVTRLLETVVHADDLADALGLDFAYDRQAVAAVTRLLADSFADQVPGGAVELRIPPYAVVQAVPGPRHTRGTPPNVVEADPMTWIRLATGRVDWISAVESAAVSASGERSNLAEWLPVLA